MSGMPIGRTARAPRVAILFGTPSWPRAAVLAALVLACWPLAAQMPPLAVDIVVLDKAGKVLRPCILWNDARSFEECKDILAREPRALAISGNIPLAGFTAPKLAWVKKHEPGIFDAVDKVLLPKDYIRYRMTGEFASDMSDSSGTYWLDVAKRQWSDELLRASDMRRDQMPRLYDRFYFPQEQVCFDLFNIAA